MSFCMTLALLLIFTDLASRVTGDPIYRYTTEGDNKQINWTISPAPGNVLVTILHPSDEVLYTALGTSALPGTGNNSERVTNTGNTNTNTGLIEFTLNDVRVTDAGDYKNRYNRGAGGKDEKYGVTLVVYDKPSKPVLTVVTAPVVGQIMLLECTASSNSKPDGHGLTMTYIWFINNADIPTDSRYVTTGSQLQINNIEKSDQDLTFTCEGYEILSLVSDASDGYTPDIKYGPGVVTLSPGDIQYTKLENSDIGTITCSADCNPSCKYQWKLNGGNLGAQSNTLTLNNIERAQAGSYQCSASNEHGNNDSTTITVEVKYGPKAVTLTPSTTSYTLIEKTENRLGSITCYADCNPKCTYQWSRDETVVVTDSILDLTDRTRADEGTYICNAKNEHGNMDSDSVTVNVEYLPEKLTVKPTTIHYVLQEKERLGPMTCSATCKPNCTYIWRLNNVNIKKGAVLDIDEINRTQSGTFNCLAFNKHGDITSFNITVNVQYQPDKVIITPKNTSYNILENAPLHITCSAVCNPTCTYQWRLNGTTLADSGPDLHIAAIKRSQSGTYNCLAKNFRGQKTINVIAVVEYPPGTVDILPVKVDYTPLEHKDSLGPITCKSDCRPTCTYRWEQNDKQINGAVLTVQNITRASTGLFRCYAWNKHSYSYSQNVSVTVHYPPENTDIMTNTHDNDLNEGDTLSVTCTTDSVPSSLIDIWLDGDGQSIVQQNPSVLKVTYTKLAECLDTGEYFCDAENRYGNSTSHKTSINVLCSPRPSDSMKTDNIVTIGEDDILDIIGSVVAYPRPKISWTFIKDGNNDSIPIENSTFGIEMLMTSNHVTYSSRLVKTMPGVEDFGDYVMNVSNPYGFVLLTFHVFSKRTPYPPYNLSVTCYKTTAKFQWTSNFNGGLQQQFIVAINKSNHVHGTYNAVDKGINIRHEQAVDNLDPKTEYSFVVTAKNLIGFSIIPTSLYCTTSDSVEEPGIPVALIGGAAGGGCILIIAIILVTVFFLKRRAIKKEESTKLMNGRGMVMEDEPDEGMKRNILYESAGDLVDRPNDSAAEYATVDKSSKKQIDSADVYAVVEKKGKKQNAAAGKSTTKASDTNSADVYAVVEKKGKKQPNPKSSKPKNKDTKKTSDKETKGEVYENFGGNFEDEYANTKPSTADPSKADEKEKPSSRRKNKDGLVYIDVVIGNAGNGKKNGIHGIEKRVEYVDIDFTRRADPLPSDDENDDTNKGKGDENQEKSENE